MKYCHSKMEGLHGSEPLDELNKVGSRCGLKKAAARATRQEVTRPQVKLNNIEAILAARIGSA
jgi:hypothetical protein